MSDYPFAVVIFVSRESSDRALRTIRDTALAAVAGTRIEVLVNGNLTLVQAISERLPDLPIPKRGSLRLWQIGLGDKANAWNEYCHRIWNDQELVWLVDGYVSPAPDALHSMQVVMRENTQALGVSAVPTMGRSAERLKREMLEVGGFHGNLCCMRGQVFRRCIEDGVSLPLGIYWVDGLLGSLLHFNLDPSRYGRDLARIVIDPQATWAIEPESASVAGLWNVFVRLNRQSRGRIENAALRDYLHEGRGSASSLPPTINEVVNAWVKKRPTSLVWLLNINPMRWLAFFRLRRYRSPMLPTRQLELVGQAGSAGALSQFTSRFDKACAQE